MAMVLGGLSRRVPHLAARVSRRPLAVAGLGLMGVGMGVLSQLGTDSSYWLLLAGIVPIGAGMALATAPATTDIVSAVPANKQGVASAVNDAAREVGGTLGIAILGSMLNQRYRSGVSDAAPPDAPSGLVDAARESLSGALGVAGRLGEQGTSLADHARHAFVDGMDLAFVVSAGTLFAVSVVFMVLIPGTKAQVLPDAAPADADDTRLETASHG
jgi:MFS family permease